MVGKLLLVAALAVASCGESRHECSVEPTEHMGVLYAAHGGGQCTCYDARSGGQWWCAMPPGESVVSGAPVLVETLGVGWRVEVVLLDACTDGQVQTESGGCACATQWPDQIDLDSREYWEYYDCRCMFETQPECDAFLAAKRQ